MLEKNRKVKVYDPKQHKYEIDKPSFVEVEKGHFVLGNNQEIEEYKKVLNNE